MVPLSIRGMTGWVNPFFLPVQRPWTLSVARRRSAGAFFCGTLGGFALWELRHGGGGARWSDAACDAPGRPTRHTMPAPPGCKSSHSEALFQGPLGVRRHRRILRIVVAHAGPSQRLCEGVPRAIPHPPIVQDGRYTPWHRQQNGSLGPAAHSFNVTLSR
jgi:hypothetical protein